MRIWHPHLLPLLNRQRLLGQHREIHGLLTIAFDNRKAYRNHPLIKWCFNYPDWLGVYHDLVVKEMCIRGYNHHTPVTWPYNARAKTPCELNETYLLRDMTDLKLKQPDTIVDV